MGDTSRISPDGGQTIYDIKDRKAVRWTEAKGYVGKNLIFATGKSQTKNGVTFTVDSDGIITANGTATAEIYFDVYEDNYTNFFKRCGGTRVKAILSGCADNGSGSTYYISFAIYNPNRVQASEYGNGNIISFTIPEDENTTCKLYINIKSGVTVSNLKFKPMIRLASVSDDTYEPYITPNTEIDNKLSYADNAITGVHNFLDSFATSSGNFTVNSDKSILVNGTFSSRTVFYLRTKETNFIPRKGTYKVSLTNTSTKLKLLVDGYMGDSWVKNLAGPTTSQGDVIIDYNGYDRVAVYILADTTDLPITVNNVTLYPQITLQADTYEEYAQFAMTNRQLTEQVVPIDITSDFATLNNEISYGSEISVHKIGKIVIGNLVLKRTGNFSADTEFNNILNIKSDYRPKKKVNSYCAFTTSEWSGTPQGVGYLFIDTNGNISVKNNMSTSAVACKIRFLYVCN